MIPLLSMTRHQSLVRPSSLSLEHLSDTLPSPWSLDPHIKHSQAQNQKPRYSIGLCITHYLSMQFKLDRWIQNFWHYIFDF